MAYLDDEKYKQILTERYSLPNRRVDVAPRATQKLGRFSLMALIVNRTIGSGIFVTPGKVYLGTGGNSGTSIIFWLAGGIIATCGLLVWLELGLSVPLADVGRDGGDDEKKSIPRSGGEKNYIEFLFGKPKFLASCLYGTVFIILGNLSGNAIAFATYCMKANGKDPDLYKNEVIGIAIAALTASVLLHICSRRGGILASNIFACCKVLLLLAIIIMGFIWTAKNNNHGEPTLLSNPGWQPGSVLGCADALIYVLYAYSGFDQPFYVLSEAKSPRRTFPSSTIPTMIFITMLFVLINVAYLGAIPKQMLDEYSGKTDFASLMLEHVLGNTGQGQRAMAALIAVSIFGNILVMTFTAARVKQEIAKEGVLPFALFFGSSYTTPTAWLKQRLSRRPRDMDDTTELLEQSPIPALLLHWLSSMVLIAVTSFLTPDQAYYTLVTLYTYVVVVGFGFVVSGGLLYLTLNPRRQWSKYCNFKIPIRPIHTVIYFLACTFLLAGAFVKPDSQSRTFASVNGIKWFVVPSIGQSAWLWGLIPYVGLQLVMKYRGKVLEVTRIPWIEKDESMRDQWVQKLEVVRHEWHAYTATKDGVPSFVTTVNEQPKLTF